VGAGASGLGNEGVGAAAAPGMRRVPSEVAGALTFTHEYDYTDGVALDAFAQSLADALHAP